MLVMCITKDINCKFKFPVSQSLKDIINNRNLAKPQTSNSHLRKPKCSEKMFSLIGEMAVLTMFLKKSHPRWNVTYKILLIAGVGNDVEQMGFYL